MVTSTQRWVCVHWTRPKHWCMFPVLKSYLQQCLPGTCDLRLQKAEQDDFSALLLVVEQWGQDRDRILLPDHCPVPRWFRNDLRLHDNPLFQHFSGELVCAYCADPRIFKGQLQQTGLPKVGKKGPAMKLLTDDTF